MSRQVSQRGVLRVERLLRVDDGVLGPISPSVRPSAKSACRAGVWRRIGRQSDRAAEMKEGEVVLDLGSGEA